MMERVSCRLICSALLALATYSAGAVAAESPEFSFSGFATAGLVHSSEKQADFTSSRTKPNGAGHTHTWSADVDTLIGMQVSATVTPRLSAVLQVIAEQNYDNTYRPHVEWANVQYQLTPDFSVRVGRTVLPTFLYSGTRKVGYTYPWVRPPLEVYGRVPVTASDGVDLLYRTHVGDFTHSVQANYGHAQQTFPHGGGTMKAERAWGIVYKLEYHDASVHLAYQRPHLTLDATKPVFDAFRQFGPAGIALADRYDVDNKPLSIVAFGASYDPGKWFATAEWVRTQNRSFIGTGTGWYVSGGYRFGKLTPYVTYAKATADNLSDPGLAAPAAAGLNAALNALLSRKAVQDTVSIGARWELTRSASLKLQFDHTRIGAGSSGVLSNLQPEFRAGGKVNVFSTTVDFVF